MKIGSCECGNIRYHLNGEPMSQVFCYCEECQKRTAGDKWFGVWYSREYFELSRDMDPQAYMQEGLTGQDVYQINQHDKVVNVRTNITAANVFTASRLSFGDTIRLKPKLAMIAKSAPNWALLPGDIPLSNRFPPLTG